MPIRESINIMAKSIADSFSKYPSVILRCIYCDHPYDLGQVCHRLGVVLIGNFEEFKPLSGFNWPKNGFFQGTSGVWGQERMDQQVKHALDALENVLKGKRKDIANVTITCTHHSVISKIERQYLGKCSILFWAHEGEDERQRKPATVKFFICLEGQETSMEIIY